MVTSENPLSVYEQRNLLPDEAGRMRIMKGIMQMSPNEVRDKLRRSDTGMGFSEVA